MDPRDIWRYQKYAKEFCLPLCPLRGNTDSLEIKNTLFQLVQCIFKTLYPRTVQLYLLFSGAAVSSAIWLSFGCHKTTFFFITDAPQPPHKFWDTLMPCSSSGCSSLHYITVAVVHLQDE